MKRSQTGELRLFWKICLLLFPIVFALTALCIGRMSLSVTEVIASIVAKITGAAQANGGTSQILWSIRVPRVILAALVGAGLSLSGCVFQSLFSNPLASPDTLGVASGASFGAALGILFGFGLIGSQLTALFFGGLAMLIARLAGKGQNSSSFVLAGIVVGSLFQALLSLVKYSADTESVLPSITYWLMGSLSGKGMDVLALGAPFIIIGGLVLFLLRWRINVLPLSEDEARSTGTNITALRGICILCCTAITASCVSMCGQVGWVGILVPHICRMMFGANHLAVVPASISLGACFMILVDTIARSATAAEIPASILTAVIGAPFFIYLMRRGRGWQL